MRGSGRSGHYETDTFRAAETEGDMPGTWVLFIASSRMGMRHLSVGCVCICGEHTAKPEMRCGDVGRSTALITSDGLRLSMMAIKVTWDEWQSEGYWISGGTRAAART